MLLYRGRHYKEVGFHCEKILILDYMHCCACKMFGQSGLHQLGVLGKLGVFTW